MKNEDMKEFGGRKKTGLPSELIAAAQENRQPNIISNVENPFFNRNPQPFRPKEKLTMRDLEQHAQTKEELYNLLTIQGQLYLMPLKACPLSFMKEILSGDRSVFQNHEIVPVNVPRYHEMTVEKIYDMVKQVPEVLRYLPSDSDGKLPRDFLFNVVNTVVPSFFSKVLPDAESKRQMPSKDDDMIIIEPNMLRLIQAFKATRHGSKKGRLHLLKKSSKKRRRAEYESRYDLSTTIADAAKTQIESDIFKRLSAQQRKGRQPQ